MSAEMDAMLRAVFAGGTHAGQPYYHSVFGHNNPTEDHYWFQQHPEELAKTLCYVKEHRTQRENYLEIGIAAGGVTRTMHEQLGFSRLRRLDDNSHPDCLQRPNNFRNLPDVDTWIGKSQEPGAAKALARWGLKYDCVLIDGGHEYEEAEDDTHLVLPYLEPGAFVLCHDFKTGLGCSLWFKELAKGAIPGLRFAEIFQSLVGGGMGIFKWVPAT